MRGWFEPETGWESKPAWEKVEIEENVVRKKRRSFLIGIIIFLKTRSGSPLVVNVVEDDKRVKRGLLYDDDLRIFKGKW